MLQETSTKCTTNVKSNYKCISLVVIKNTNWRLKNIMNFINNVFSSYWRSALKSSLLWSLSFFQIKSREELKLPLKLKKLIIMHSTTIRKSKTNVEMGSPQIWTKNGVMTTCLNDGGGGEKGERRLYLW